MKTIVLSMALLFVLASLLLAHDGSVSQVSSAGLEERGTAGVLQTNQGGSFEYLLLKQSVSLWSDGRGDVILEQHVENQGVWYWDRLTWYFSWPEGEYSNIRAWDETGPLDISTSTYGTLIYVTVYFREQVNIGESYLFNLAITIGHMASGSGNDWRANWYTSPGSPAEEFIEGITFPSNATIDSISPPPTTQELNYVEWRYTDRPGGWVLTIDVFYTLSDTIAVPLLKQIDPPWEDDPYAHYPPNSIDDIGKWGCYLTSATMIINYWGDKSSTPFTTDPGVFNSWLKQHGGYNPSNQVIHSKIFEYATSNGVQLYNRGYIPGRDDARLDDSLLSGNPVIIGVDKRYDDQGRPYAGHFVVATGKTTVNSVDTYAINDPVYGQTTLYDRWQNDYYSVLFMSSTPADQRTLSISAHSPVELLVTDPLGRKAGYDPDTGFTWDQIPDTEYFVSSIVASGGIGPEELPLSKTLFISVPLDGEYTVEVLGIGDGSYEILTVASNWEGEITQQSMAGTAQSGSKDVLDVVYSSYTGVHYFFNHLPIILR